jgi:pre-mRNA-splicing factor ATP-dependent RNA helicase DHX38/PRP16
MDDLPIMKQLAILISRSLNTLNPNDVLAKTVFTLSQSHTLPTFTKAISSFGKFTPDDAQQIFELCQQQDTIAEAFKLPGSGLTITDSDVLPPEIPQGRPGLTVAAAEDKHVFKAPALPRTSALGLDRLAMEKRRERGEPERPQVKRIKYDDEDEVKPDEFKSESIFAAFCSYVAPR